MNGNHECIGAVLLSHSQSGPFPLDAALINPDGIRGMVLVEPGTCRSTVYTDQQIATLAKADLGRVRRSSLLANGHTGAELAESLR
jgi:hypothetical protein